jgi:TonB family protein
MRVVTIVVVTIVVIALFLAVGLCAQQQPAQAKPDTAVAPKNSGISRAAGGLEVLSDTQGVDFGPYLSKVVAAIRKNWYSLVPEEAKPPELKAGRVAIEFAILPDGRVTGMKLTGQSGDVVLDRAAWGGITASNPFAPLPSEYHGPYLALRFNFYYNPKKMPSNDPSQSNPH